MKMIRAMIRPEREAEVLKRLEAEDLYAVTKLPVRGRGRQRGIKVGAVSYDELAKTMVMLIVADADLARAVRAIEEGARTGHPGDGRIFVQTVREAYNVRTGQRANFDARRYGDFGTGPSIVISIPSHLMVTLPITPLSALPHARTPLP